MGQQSQSGQVGFRTQREKATLSTTGTVSAGTFTLSYAGQTTTAIAYNASAAVIKAALEALTNLVPGDVIVTGGPMPSTPVAIHFASGINVANLTGNGALLTGSTPVLVVTIAQAKGVFAAPGDTVVPGVFARILSGSMSGNRDLIIPDPEIGGNRDIPDAYLGPIAFSGSYEMYGRAKFVATMLRAALGTAVSTLVTDHYEHTITPLDTGSLPWLSVEEAIADSYEVFNYTDVKVNSLHFECDAEGYLKVSCDLIGLTQTAGNTRTVTPAWDTTPLFVGSNITCTYNAVSLPAKAFSLDINNNIEDNDFRLGSVALGDAVEKRREVMAGVTIRPDDSSLWRQATYGSSVATSAAAGAAVKQQLVVTILTYELIPGADVEKYSIIFTIPKATIKPYSLSPSGDDVIEHDFEIQALRPLNATPIITAVVWSDQVDIA